MIIETLDRIGRRISDPELLDVLGSVTVGLVQKNVIAGNWAPNSAMTQAVKQNAKPLRDSGGLLSSFNHRRGQDSAIIGTNHPAAEILHNGGTITPKRSKFLALPLGRETRAFMRQYGLTPRACIEGMKAAGYSIWIAKAVVMARKGKKGKPHALFLLRRSVTVPARPFFRLPPASIRVLERVVARRVFA
jgi:phage gpG-like protein